MAPAWHRLYDDDVERLGYTDRLIGFIFAMQNPAASVREIAVETGISLRSAYAAWGLARERSGTPGGTKTEQAKPPPWPPPEESRNKNGTANGTAIDSPFPSPSPLKATTETTTTETTTTARAREEGFDAFWKAYPKRKKKLDAKKAWKVLKPTPELQALILTALEWQRQTYDWTKEDGQFIPLPATWLRAGCWEDERVEQPATPIKKPVDQRAFFTDTPEKPHGLPRRKG